MSRRAAEEEIAAGHVLVNGETARLGDRADPETDAIVINGWPLPRQEKKLYIMLNKPKGTVTTLRDEKGRRNVTELVLCCGVLWNWTAPSPGLPRRRSWPSSTGGQFWRSPFLRAKTGRYAGCANRRV